MSRMTVVEYASLCSKETKTLQYGDVEVQKKRKNDDEFPEVHGAIAVATILSYYILTIIGHIRDFLRKINVLKRGNSAVKDVSSEHLDTIAIYSYRCTFIHWCFLPP